MKNLRRSNPEPMKSIHLANLCIMLGTYAYFSIRFNYLRVEDDFLMLKGWGQMGYEPEYMLELFLHKKFDVSFAQFFEWMLGRWVTVPVLVFSLISAARLVQPFWWLALWIERVNTNGDRLEERLKSYTEVSIPESIKLYFKALSLDTQSRVIRRVVRWMYRKYQIDPTDASSPPP